MRSLVFAALACLFTASAADARVLITIDKSTQRLTVAVDGVQRWTWPVSTGRRGRETPQGTFQAFRMERDHYSKEWDDAPMPHSIFFTKRGHAIHGSLDTRRIGSPASAGCVRLEPQNARALFELVEQQGVLNTTVVIAGVEPPASAPAVARASPNVTPRLPPTQQPPPPQRTVRAPQYYEQRDPRMLPSDPRGYAVPQAPMPQRLPPSDRQQQGYSVVPPGYRPAPVYQPMPRYQPVPPGYALPPPPPGYRYVPQPGYYDYYYR